MAKTYKFAVAPSKLLTILLMVLLFYISVETVRLLILSSSVKSGSSQGARYGATSGTGNTGIWYFQDCRGIRQAANQANRSRVFDSIIITYDTGPDTDILNSCDGAVDTSIIRSDNSRIVVTVSQEFKPLIPQVAPLFPKNVKATSARTILEDVSSVITPTPPSPESTSITEISIDQQLANIDNALKQSLSASIAYNAPKSMKLLETATISLLLNPSVAPENLSTQVAESGQIISSSIEASPHMKAVLLSQNLDAFSIQNIHDAPEQVISSSETTQWSWLVTAQKEGVHTLNLAIYRVVTVDGQDFWRLVETYESNIDVKVTPGQRISQFDWKWLAGIVITALLIPAFWRWLDYKRTQSELVKTAQEKAKTRKMASKKKT